jgi:hypothetical protein
MHFQLPLQKKAPPLLKTELMQGLAILFYRVTIYIRQ